MSFTEKATKNIDSLVANGMAGEGPMARYFADTADVIEANIVKTNNQRLRNDPNATKIEGEALRVKVNEALKQHADTFVKPELHKAVTGKAKEENKDEQIDSAKFSENLQYYSGLGSAASATYSAFSSNNIFGLFGGLASLLGYVGDYVTAAISYMTGKKDDPNAPNSYGEALENIRAPKRLNDLAQKIPGMDVQGTIAYLAEDPAKHSKPLEPKAAMPVAAVPKPEVANIALDGSFNSKTKEDILKSEDKALSQVQQAIKDGKIELNGGIYYATSDVVKALDAVPQATQIGAKREGESWSKDK